MTAPAIQTLAEVLQHVDRLPWGYAIYLDPQRPWHADTRCVLLDPNDVDDPDTDDAPMFAQQHGLRYTLTVSALQDVVVNARGQQATLTVADLIQAFSY
jgi:hypothetical protein